ncbi:MAG TPA: PIG-L family deacetylase [Candidatus Hydrogenedentes bacterium]|nr:PIG-L family deacetylase [Candidatus Hydrogenedentota bacterium]
MTRRDALRRSGVLASALGLPLADAQAADTSLKVVVFGAHPDDPESGCGGLMALYADAGHEVVAMYLTRGEAGIDGTTHDEAARVRTAEAEAACGILGARPVFVGQIDGATELNAAWYATVRALIEEEDPDLVLTQWPVDSHRDHRIAGLLVYDAWEALDRRFSFYYYEVESGGQTQLFAPTHYVDITSVEQRKREANLAHASQNPVGGFYTLHERMHAFRGREVGVRHAEAFLRHSQSAASLE